MNVNAFWVPVNMGLPKMGERVLVVCTNMQNQMQEHVSIASWWPIRWEAGKLKEPTNAHWSGHRHVTHWAPLPKLPSK